MYEHVTKQSTISKNKPKSTAPLQRSTLNSQSISHASIMQLQSAIGNQGMIQLLQRKLAQEKKPPNNTGLPDNLKSGIESLSGMSMDHVKVHYNSNQPAQLNAHAYAQGTDIHIAPGQEEHLPHEAWHVVQQAQGRVNPTTQMKGMNVNDDTGLETEADVMGAKALNTKNSIGEKEPLPIGTNDLGNVKQCVYIGGVITGYTVHGEDQALTRDQGRGVSDVAIQDAVDNPVNTVQQSNGSTKYIGSDAVVVLNANGKVVTTWAKNWRGRRNNI